MVYSQTLSLPYALYPFRSPWISRPATMGSTVGVIPPPPGVTPDFDYSNPRGFRTEMIIFGVGLFLSTLFLAMRVYTRACLLSKFGWDDGISIFLPDISETSQIAKFK